MFVETKFGIESDDLGVRLSFQYLLNHAYRVVIRSYSVVMMLLLVYRSPALSFIPETRDEALIKTGYEILSAWNQLPALRRGLIRAQEMMLLVNISIPTN